METLETLSVENVLDTSLTNLLPTLSRVPTLRNLLISNTLETFGMNPPEGYSTDTIESIGCKPEFLDQILPALPQQSIAHIKSLSIYYGQYRRVQSLPSCLSELIPKMERLNTLFLETVLDTSLIELLMSAMSRVSTLRNIVINSFRKETFRLKFPPEDYSTGTIESVNCIPKFLDQLLPALPQQSIANIRSLTIRYNNEFRIEEKRDYLQCQHQPLPFHPVLLLLSPEWRDWIH